MRGGWLRDEPQQTGNQKVVVSAWRKPGAASLESQPRSRRGRFLNEADKQRLERLIGPLVFEIRRSKWEVVAFHGPVGVVVIYAEGERLELQIDLRGDDESIQLMVHDELSKFRTAAEPTLEKTPPTPPGAATGMRSGPSSSGATSSAAAYYAFFTSRNSELEFVSLSVHVSDAEACVERRRVSEKSKTLTVAFRLDPAQSESDSESAGHGYLVAVIRGDEAGFVYAPKRADVSALTSQRGVAPDQGALLVVPVRPVVCLSRGQSHAGAFYE
jgi:hypothetical protein